MATAQSPHSSASAYVPAWLDEAAGTNTPRHCLQPGCHEISRHGDNYGVQHACHLCYRALSSVQFQNGQGFCIPCYKAEARGRHHVATPRYPVVEFDQPPIDVHWGGLQ